MSFINWCKSFADCCSSAHNWLLFYSDWNKLQYFLNSLRFLYETFWKDGLYIIYHDFVYSVKKIVFDRKKSEIINEINWKVVILIPWFSTTTWALSKLKQWIESSWYNCVPIDTRVFFHNIKKTRINVIKQVLKIIEDKWSDNIVLCWYSYWWAIAHLIWEKYWIPQVTYGTPLNPESSPFAVWANYYWIDMWLKSIWANELSTDIVEQYSFANP